MNDPLADIATQYSNGVLTRDEFLDRCDEIRSTPNSGGTLDIDRQRRCGFSEVIYGEGKSPDQIRALIEGLCGAGQPVFVTRLDDQKAKELTATFPAAQYNAVARTLRMGDSEPLHGRTAVVCAGTSDLYVAEEARETLRWMGSEPYFACDVGVAGPHRLLTHLPALRAACAVVVVAGMEGALPSVVAGHIAAPVIAVPTSVGYGAALGGIAALLGMLTSCAANVCVTNIDAGFKGGYVAGLVARQNAHPSSPSDNQVATN